MSGSLHKSTRYALYAAIEMARAWPGAPVTATEVAARYAIPSTVLAKVLQQLARGGIAVGTRGTGGGYSLARAPSQLTVLDVIEIFEAPHPLARCLLAEADGPIDEHHELYRLRGLLTEVDELVRCTYASVSLETLVGKRATAAEPRPVARD